MNALAYQTDLLPGGIAMRAIFASDIGHWDVPDIREVLPEAYELVEKGLITASDFRKFTFEDPVRLFTAQNPDFFLSTTVAQAASSVVE